MKITYKQFREIMNYKKSHPIQALLSYQLIVDVGVARITPYIPLWLYIVSFIPVHLFQAVLLLWDGGLKEFELQPRNLPSWIFQMGSMPYETAKDIWKRG